MNRNEVGGVRHVRSFPERGSSIGRHGKEITGFVLVIGISAIATGLIAWHATLTEPIPAS